MAQMTLQNDSKIVPLFPVNRVVLYTRHTTVEMPYSFSRVKVDMSVPFDTTTR